VPPGGTVVLAFAGNQAFLNNAGDTVRLYDNQRKPIDAVAYTQSDAPQGKSIARFPDGIGGWWDPVPTPGLPNQPVPTDTPLAKRSLVIPSEEDTRVFETAASEVAAGNPDLRKKAKTSTSTPAISSPDLNASEEETGESYGNEIASSTPLVLTAREEPRSASTTPEASQEAHSHATSGFTPQQGGSDNLLSQAHIPPSSSSPPSESLALLAPPAPSGAQVPAYIPPCPTPQENTQEQDASLRQRGGVGECPEESDVAICNPPFQTSENGDSKGPAEARSEADAAESITLEL
jgi:hypothetical protein